MKARISVITLAVDDLERALMFYRDGLGLQSEGIIGTEFEYGAVVFIDLQAGLKLALWPRASLCRDTGLALGSTNPAELSIGHNVASKTEVDAVMEQAKQAGAVIIKPAQDTSGVAMVVIFRTPINISGRSSGILILLTRARRTNTDRRLMIAAS